jgi:hypothetical protein
MGAELNFQSVGKTDELANATRFSIKDAAYRK